MTRKQTLTWLALFLLLNLMIGLNEFGFGVFALLLLFPACWLLEKALKS